MLTFRDGQGDHRLGGIVLDALALACDLGRWDVAEHLLSALETLEMSGSSPSPDNSALSDPLEAAYRRIAADGRAGRDRSGPFLNWGF